MLTKTKAKYIQSLGQKKFRAAEGLFLAEGPKLVAELIQEKKAEVKEVFALQSWADEHKSLLKDGQLTIISEAELEKISQLTTPNQALAIVKQWEYLPPDAVKNAIVLALDDIRDPGNLGTIIRIADWFGISEIVCSMECADCYNPKVVQATMGSIGRVNISYTDLEEWIVKTGSKHIYAAVLEGKDIHTVNNIKEGILLIGNEAKGISAALVDIANVKITIPRKGQAESLNAAVATGIILSHLL